jgi:hypothetical protein
MTSPILEQRPTLAQINEMLVATSTTSTNYHLPHTNHFGMIVRYVLRAGRRGHMRTGTSVHLVWADLIEGFEDSDEGKASQRAGNKVGGYHSAQSPCNSNGQHISAVNEHWDTKDITCGSCLKRLINLIVRYNDWVGAKPKRLGDCAECGASKYVEHRDGCKAASKRSTKAALLENSHQEGYHDEAPDASCPTCQASGQALVGKTIKETRYISRMRNGNRQSFDRVYLYHVSSIRDEWVIGYRVRPNGDNYLGGKGLDHPITLVKIINLGERWEVVA